MKKLKFLVCLAIASVCLSSCMVTKTSVGNYKENKGQVYEYSKDRQGYLFWGLLPVGKCDITTPTDQNCQVRTRTTFVDGLVSLLTGGIYSMQTVQVVAKKDAKDQSAFAKGDKVAYPTNLSCTKFESGVIESLLDDETCLVKAENGKMKKVKLENLAK
ncbi:MAG: Bor family protein [Paludibacteraceae bacterium]|nr:Bor family protein [Paludibacteraceae bacterium]